jgi:hypothetical protein
VELVVDLADAVNLTRVVDRCVALASVSIVPRRMTTFPWADAAIVTGRGMRKSRCRLAITAS